MDAGQWGALVIFTLAVAGVVTLWAIGHPSVIDRGPAPGERYPFWDDHSIGHLIGSLVLALVFCWLTSPTGGFFDALTIGVLVELAQLLPADGGKGYFGWEDVAVDAIGALVGVLLCGAL